MLRRLVLLGSAGLLLCGFTFTADYEREAKSDVDFCASYTRRDVPSFETSVVAIDRATGAIQIDRRNASGSANALFDRCLVGVRKWRLVERYLPKTADPTQPTASPTDRVASRDSLAR